MNKPLLSLVMLLVALLFEGCSELPKRPVLHDFGLVKASSVPINTELRVDAPTWLGDNRLRYRLLYADSTQIRFYAYDLWLASPPELLEQFLQNSGHSIMLPLTIRLLAFEQQFDSPNKARVVLKFSAEAYAKDHRRQLGAQLFSFEQPTKTPDAEGAVAGFIDLTRQANRQLQVWLAGLNVQ